MTGKTQKHDDAPRMLEDAELEQARGGTTGMRTESSGDADKDAFRAGLRGGTTTPADDGAGSGDGRGIPGAL